MKTKINKLIGELEQQNIDTTVLKDLVTNFIVVSKEGLKQRVEWDKVESVSETMLSQTLSIEQKVTIMMPKYVENFYSIYGTLRTEAFEELCKNLESLK